MITPSDKYSTRRMWTVVQHYCVANSRNLAISMAMTFLIIFLISLLLSKLMRFDSEARFVSVMIFYMSAGGLILTVLGSLAFSSYSTKPKRISAMMLPAKKSEKFIALCLIYVVFGNLWILFSCVVSDISTALMFSHDSMINRLLEPIFTHPGDIPYCLIVTAVTGLFLLSQSIFVLGSALWPKLSFLKTYVAQSIFQAVLVVIIPFALVGNVFYGVADIIGGLDLDEQDAINIAWALIGLLYLVIAGIYALAWLRFRSLAVAKRFLS